MSILDNNLTGLAKFQDYLVNAIKNYAPPAERTVKVIRAANGQRTARIKGLQDYWYPVASLVNPGYEADQRCKVINYAHSLFIIVFGSGFAHSLHSIFTQKEREAFVICVEPNMELLWETFSNVDLTPMFNTNRIFFLTGSEEEMLDQFSKVIISLAIFYAIKPAFLFLPQTKFDSQELFRSLPLKMIEKIKLQAHNIAGDIHDSLIGLEQTIFNIDEYLNNPTFRGIGDTYEGMPIFVVSTGPSLDKNVEELKKVQGQGLIFCAESAAIPLMKRGIVPDALFIMERIPESYEYHVKDINYPPETVLFALTLVNTRIFDSWQGLKVPVFPHADPNSNAIHELCGSPGNMYSGISAANMAFSMARKLKAGTIIFVGQDLAYGPEGRSHAGGAQYGDTTGKQEKDPDLVFVPDYTGNLIPSTFVWLRFLRWFEQEIARTDIPVVDATEGGAYIQGTEVMSLREAINRYCVQPLPSPFHEYIREIKSQCDYTKDEKLEIVKRVQEWLEERISEHQQVADKAKKELDNTRNNYDLLRNRTDELRVNPIVQDTAESQKLLDLIKQTTSTRFFFQTHMMGMHFRALDIGTIDTIEKLERMLQVLEIFLELVSRAEEEAILIVLRNSLLRVEAYNQLISAEK